MDAPTPQSPVAFARKSKLLPVRYLKVLTVVKAQATIHEAAYSPKRYFVENREHLILKHLPQVGNCHEQASKTADESGWSNFCGYPRIDCSHRSRPPVTTVD
ncbi:MAG TPA: hypothetical protein VKX49_24105 [Bryobacteraceae bacterium]|nr:hypothetical protein [Bryobacteraceae bacterium]